MNRPRELLSNKEVAARFRAESCIDPHQPICMPPQSPAKPERGPTCRQYFLNKRPSLACRHVGKLLLFERHFHIRRLSCALLIIERCALLQRSLCKACLALHHTDDLCQRSARGTPACRARVSAPPMTLFSRFSGQAQKRAVQLRDARNAPLLLRFTHDARSGRQLQHGRMLAFAQPGE